MTSIYDINNNTFYDYNVTCNNIYFSIISNYLLFIIFVDFDTYMICNIIILLRTNKNKNYNNLKKNTIKVGKSLKIY